ncbi:restriction endonuclease subunit M [Marinifilum sp. JC120]|nr:restriction endonuclease subunit M [Marinifilum sp. JC120]
MSKTNKIIPLIPPGKVLCFITGLLRKDKPEENVRQRWARTLVEDYGYEKEDVGVEVTIAMGRAKKRCDLAVFKHGAEHAQENIVIAIEVKRDDIKSSDTKYGDAQLISYMAASPMCKFGLWAGEELRAYSKSETGEIDRVADIPRSGDEVPRKPRRTDLHTVHELTSVFKRCHNYIHANGGLQKAEAFHELLKLIFCKTYEEAEGEDELQFSIDPSEQRSVGGQRKLLQDRLTPLFTQVKRVYPFIFQEDELIKLEPDVAAYVVAELQYISILNSSTDVKGEAYETLVGANLRGDRGEYFTPRNVCDMTVQIIMSMFSETKISSLKVVDCCCGTGGFLVSWMDNLRNMLVAQEKRRGTPDIPNRVRERIKQICGQDLYGTDINPFLVRTAQMNMVMHGDGSTNIHKANSLKRPGEWIDESRLAVPYGKFDVVITNPPFGDEVRVDDAHVLSQYQLAEWGSENRRSMMPAEQLFMEATMNFLKPGGIMGIVIPDGILNNPGLAFLRDWLVKNSRIVASIDLPKETFGRNKGVNNPSVLIAQKFTKAEMRNAAENRIDTNYEVFMCTPKTSGINKRGNTVFLRHPNGEYILNEDGKRIPDDQISHVCSAFQDWQNKTG